RHVPAYHRYRLGEARERAPRVGSWRGAAARRRAAPRARAAPERSRPAGPRGMGARAVALRAWPCGGGSPSLRPRRRARAGRLPDPPRQHADAEPRSDGPRVPLDDRRVDRRRQSVLPAAPAVKTVLIVCHANTARSVMAHVMLERMLAERGIDDVRVRSGGVA